MTWDAQKYEQWFSTPRGAFALEQEKRLLDAMLAGWPRRCRKLVEVGCGTGVFLHLLWEMGFDVTGVDSSPVMLKAARERFGNKAALHLAKGEHLPFEDDEFDFAVVWSVLEFAADPLAMLSEAARVAEEGVLVGFLNRHSLYYRSHGRNRGAEDESTRTLARARWYSWPEVKRMLKAATGRKPSLVRSVLHGPTWTWNNSLLRLVNTPILRPPLSAFGAFTAARVDFKDRKPLTPLPALLTKPEGAG